MNSMAAFGMGYVLWRSAVGATVNVIDKYNSQSL
jgi:hypothetical protein